MTETSEPVNDSAGSDPCTQAWELLRGPWRFATMHALVATGCLDELHEQPLSVPELAGRGGLHAPSLRRLLRHAARIGLVAANNPETYRLTELGEVLCTGSPRSMRSAVLTNGLSLWWQSLMALPSTLRTGQPALLETYGTPYAYLAERPHERELFGEFMRSRSVHLAEQLSRRYDFSAIDTLVDVGGGTGHILRALLEAYPHLHGMLLDRETVIPAAHDLLKPWITDGRCEVIAGDYFDALPGGAAVYLLASVIHNWGDQQAVRLLRTVRAALPPGGRVLLIETLLAEDDRPDTSVDLDVRLLSLFDGGRERAEDEYAALLSAAGLRLERVLELTPAPLRFWLIEAVVPE